MYGLLSTSRGVFLAFAGIALALQLGNAFSQGRTLNVQSAKASSGRFALVIGNDSYTRVSKLANARADARAIAGALEQAGFDVTLRVDLGDRAMRETVRNFKARLSGGDEAVFYFAGHGVQLGPANYLLPVDVAAESEEQVKDDGLPLQRILDDLADQKVRLSLVIIDACRDNPFPKVAGRSIGGTRGLAPTTAATGQIIIYSAGAGQVALDRLNSDDRNPNGVFTRVFLQEMQKPGLPVDRVLRNVREQVVAITKSIGHQQVPALYDQAIGDFYFRPAAAGIGVASAVPSPAPTTIASIAPLVAPAPVPPKIDAAAVVNGVPIPTIVLNWAAKNEIKRGHADTPEFRKRLKDDLIALELVAQKAADEGLARRPDPRAVATEIEAEAYAAQLKAVATGYLAEHFRRHPLGESRLKEEYDRVRADTGDKEYKVRHILVKTEAEAREVIENLGYWFADWEMLARRHSLDDSKYQGGDLGWRLPSAFVKPFADALRKLEKGKYTPQPVRSEFGWHVIQLDDTRAYALPSFDAKNVRAELENRVKQKEVQRLVAELRTRAKIE